MLFIEIAIAFVIIFGSVCGLNQKNMIPGTERYNRINDIERKTMEIERARMDLQLSRVRLRETENIDKILQLPAGTTDNTETGSNGSVSTSSISVVNQQ